MQHSFDIEVAKEYGIEEAVILNNLYFWIEKNRANGQNFYDGYYWTYNSVKAFNELFPYMSSKKIRNALKHLIDEGILITGNYNERAYDRTLWYALTEKGNSICRNGQMDFPKRANGNVQKGEPIPNINTDINTDNNICIGAKPKTPKETKRFTPPTVDEVKEYCRERNNNINAEYFVDYYATRNWELSKGRKVKNWKACVRTWENNDFKRNGEKANSKIEIDQNFRDKFLKDNDPVDWGM